jgi:hypothetical protein
LSAGGVHEQGACLDTLPALMLDTPINQKVNIMFDYHIFNIKPFHSLLLDIQEFLMHDGIKKVSELVKHENVDETIRSLTLTLSLSLSLSVCVCVCVCRRKLYLI